MGKVLPYYPFQLVHWKATEHDMKQAWTKLGKWQTAAIAVAILVGTGACSKKTGVEGGFEYTAGLFSAELTGIVENGAETRAALEGKKKRGESETVAVAEQTVGDGTGEGQEPMRLVVPARLGGKMVRSVGARAFEKTENAVSVKIPRRVSRIGEEAFAECTNLVWVELPSHLKKVEEGLFYNCSRMVESEIPKRVEEIGARAYYGCSQLKRVAVPATLRSVGAYAFSGCSSLGSLDLPTEVTEIGEYAFHGCKAMESFILPPQTKKIGDGSFSDCSGLERVEIPGEIQEIGESAFSRFAKLRLVAIPGGVTNIGSHAFFGCAALEEAVVPTEVCALAESVFEECTGMKRVGLPSGLTTIGSRAFFGCEALESVELPTGLCSIGEGAFAGCLSLAHLELPQGVVNIPDGAFEGCRGLRTVRIPDGVTNIGARAFAGCTLLERIELPTGVRSVGEEAFAGCDALERMNLPGTVESIGEAAFRDCRRLRQAILGEGLRGLGNGAFMGCSALWEFAMPESVERTGGDLFAGCNGLLVLAVPDKLMGKSSPVQTWQVPDDCTVCSRSEWDAVLQGKGAGTVENPFYGLYAGKDLDTVAFEGTVLTASLIPDPAKNDYDNCLYALLVELDSVLSSSPGSSNVERVVLVNVPILKDRSLIEQNRFNTGDKIACTCAEYDAMPQAIQEIQLSDDIQAFEYQQYYPLRIKQIPEFQGSENKNFAKREISIPPIQSLQRDENALSARRERIQQEMARIENELEKHGGSFEAWREEYKTIADKYGKLCMEKFAGWINDSYFAAKIPETTYLTQDYIEGILPYKKYLEENNIDLVVVRIPSRWDFAARVLASDDFQENPDWVEHYYECLKNDIEIIDPMPEMWKERFDFPLFYFYHISGEYHPCEGASFVVAKEIAKVLARYPFQKAASEIVLTNALFETDQPRFFWPGGNEKFDSSRNMVFKQVFQDGEPIGDLAVSSGSPFVFLSNSYFWYPQRPLGASIPGYVAYFIQALPDWLYQDGANDALIKYLFSRPHVLDGRKVVIMVGQPSAWKGLPPIPQYIQDRASRITLEGCIPACSEEITIHDNDSFSHTAYDEESVWFEANGTPTGKRGNQFEMEFSIPRLEGKRTCMVRVHINDTSNLKLNLLGDGDDSIVDTCFLEAGRQQFADFFVALTNATPNVRLRFQPRYPERGVGVKNFELWYY